jgi:hypothetical protein
MSTVSRNTQQASGFDPRNTPNCTLWLDAADTRTVTGTTTVTAWADKSGNGFNGTLVTISTTPALISNALNGKSVINFTGGSYMTTTLSLGTTQPFTLFTVARPGFNGTTMAVATVNGNGATRPNCIILFKESNTYNNNWTMGGGTLVTQGNLNTLSASPSRYDINANYWAPNSTQVNVNGTSYASSSSAPASITAGATFVVGAANELNLGQLWNGHIAEIILFSATLTQPERQQVEGYLAWKWGIQTQLPTHPYQNIPPLLRQAFVPTDFANCCSWLDASDRTTFRLSGSNVSRIVDKADGATFTVGGTPTWSSTGFNSVYAGFNMTNGRFLKAISSMTKYQHTAFIVTKLSSTPGDGAPCVAFAESPSGSAIFYRVLDSRTTPQFRTIAITTSLFAATTTYTTDNIIFSGIFDGSRAISSRLFRGTENNFSVSGTGNEFTTDAGAIMIGTDGASPTGNTWPGVIAEVIVYRNVNLSNEQRRLVEAYLAWKWGVPTILPSTHIYYNYWPLKTTNAFRPLDISGCQLWLDASDESTITLSGSDITTWVDKSSNARNGVCSAGKRFTYSTVAKNNRRVVQSAVGQCMTISGFVLGATMSIFVVYMPINQSTEGPFVELSADSNTNNGFYFRSGNNSNFNIRNNGNLRTTNFGNTTVSNTWQILEGINKDPAASNLMSFYTDGTLRASTGNTISDIAVTATLNINGRNNNLADNSLSTANYIAEILIYNVALTASQRQMVEGYIAWKWGLVANLPLTHPFKYSEPTSTTI